MRVAADGLSVLDVSTEVDETFEGLKNDIRVEPQFVRNLGPEPVS